MREMWDRAGFRFMPVSTTPLSLGRLVCRLWGHRLRRWHWPDVFRPGMMIPVPAGLVQTIGEVYVLQAQRAIECTRCHGLWRVRRGRPRERIA